MKAGPHQYCSLVYPPWPTRGLAHSSCLINICGRKGDKRREEVGKGGRKKEGRMQKGKKEKIKKGRKKGRLYVHKEESSQPTGVAQWLSVDGPMNQDGLREAANQ